MNGETIMNSAEKLREAVVNCVNLIAEFGNAEIVKTPLDVIVDIEAILKAALAAPPRNCDVGTVTEQEDRFEKFCDAHKYVGDDGANVCSRDCPCYNGMDCGIRWAQMPYESEVAK